MWYLVVDAKRPGSASISCELCNELKYEQRMESPGMRSDLFSQENVASLAQYKVSRICMRPG